MQGIFTDAVVQVQVWSIMVLFVLSGLCSMSETALVGMSRIKILGYIRNNHPAGKYLKVWMDDPNKLIATILIFNNIVNIAASTIGAFLSIRIAEHAGFNQAATTTAMAATITIILIIFSEITPKTFAIHSTEKLGLLLIRPVVYLYYIIRPLTHLFAKIGNIIVKAFGGKPLASIPVISAKDISTVIDASMEQGFIDETEKKMMAGVLELGDMQVKEIMVPRTSISAIDVKWEFEKIIDFVLEDGYSRMPVYQKDLDHILGIVYTKDMLSMIKNRGLIIFQDLIRIPTFVPGTTKVVDLMKEFKKGKFHMAIIVDEFGGTAGLITLEDILEEIVGEIKDEYDTEERAIEQVGTGVYMVRGKCEIDRLNEDYRFNLPEQEEGVHTIGGFVSALFGRVPKEGEAKEFGDLVFTIVKADARKIDRIKISKKNPQQSGQAK